MERWALRKGMRWDRIWIIPPMLWAHLGPRPERKRKRASIRSSKPNQLSIECIKEKEKRAWAYYIIRGLLQTDTKARVTAWGPSASTDDCVCLGLFWTITRTYKKFWPVCFTLAHRDGKGVHKSYKRGWIIYIYMLIIITRRTKRLIDYRTRRATVLFAGLVKTHHRQWIE